MTTLTQIILVSAALFALGAIILVLWLIRRNGRALANAQAEMSSVLSALTDMILVTDDQGLILHIVPTSPGPVYQLDPKFLGRFIQDLLPSGKANSLIEKLHVALESRQPVQFEYPLEIKTRVFWFLVTVTPMRKNSVLWVGRDITGRKQAEEELHSLNTNLELLVNERTAQLVAVNQVLTDENAERKAVEETLREAELRYRTLVEQIPAATYIVSPGNTGILYNSPQIEEISGFTCEQWNSTPAFWENQIYPEDRPRVVAEMDRCQACGQTFQCEYRLVTRAGLIRWVMDTASMIQNSTGQTVFLQGVIFDITSRKQYEEQLQQNIARADALSEISSVLVESTLDHQEALNLLARRTVELVGDSCVIRLLSEDGQWLDMVALDHRDPVSKEIQAKIMLEYPQKADEGILGQVVARGEALLMAVVDPQQIKDEFKPEFLPLLEQPGIDSMMVVPLKAQGRLLGVMSLTRDQRGNPYTTEDFTFAQNLAERAALSIANTHLYIENLRRKHELEVRVDERTEELLKANALLEHELGERRRAEEKLALQAKELARSNAELEQFAYVASHDLQEPLRLIASYTHLLEKRYKDKLDADANEFIGYTVESTTRMQRLITDLLTYSRVSTRGKPFDKTDLNEALKQALFNLQIAIEENQALITYDSLPALNADAIQMAQLFQNLIGNAIKFHGQEPPCIHVSVRPAGEVWIIAVKDNGIGIDPRFSERIFVLFQRLHDRSEYPGTGIGLAICKRIVERHQGKIWVDSEPGRGATFYFTLPAQP
jgi:PAS domain S-box-containing protein